MTMGLAVVEMGLRINAVLPGPVETPILVDFEESMGKDNLDGVKELLGRHADPDDIASAVLFLASDEARWINGHALVVDGGIAGAVTHRSRSGARDLRAGVSIQALADNTMNPSTSTFDMSGLRRVFATGRTRGLRWRLSQLEGIERFATSGKRDIAAALHADLGRPAGRSVARRHRLDQGRSHLCPKASEEVDAPAQAVVALGAAAGTKLGAARPAGRAS